MADSMDSKIWEEVTNKTFNEWKSLDSTFKDVLSLKLRQIELKGHSKLFREAWSFTDCKTKLQERLICASLGLLTTFETLVLGNSLIKNSYLKKSCLL